MLIMINLPGKRLYLKFNLVLKATWYIFNSQFYKQTDGVAMEGPRSSITAEIYMQAHQ